MSVARLLILAVAGVAAVFVWLYVRSSSASAPAEPAVAAAPAPAETRVLVAARALEIGTRITPADMTWRAWPEGGIAPEYATDKIEPQGLQDRVGSVVRDNISAGEPILARKIVTAGESGFMAAILTPGHRAISVRINATSGVGGFILPGDRVDVILSYQATEEGSGRRAKTARTVLENVRVLAIDQTPQRDDDDQVRVGSTATLELSPTDAETLALALTMGDLTLALRSIADINPDAVAADASRRLGGVGEAMTIYRYGSVSTKPVRGMP